MIVAFKHRWRLGNLLRLPWVIAQVQPPVIVTTKLELTTTIIARTLIQQVVSFDDGCLEVEK